jgi:DNA-binding CsgD family transcriptional regulator/tetratricopeptide (TPR) repeat protein
MTSRALIGRDDELRALTAVVSAAREGSAAIALVAGDAGIGKTRLVSAAVEQLRSDGFVVAVGGCVQLGSVSVAFAPLAEALRQLHGQIDDAELTERAGALQTLLAGGAADAGGSVLDRLLSFLIDLGRERPVLLVLEDLHWADASTRDLVAFLGRNLRDARVALVLTYRDDEVHRRHPLRAVLSTLERDADVERIELAGLDRCQLVALLDDICEQPPTSDVVDGLLARSGGNPFYVEELVAYDNVGEGLPGTLSDVIMARVGALSDESQGVLHAAAVVDDDIDDELVSAVSGVPVGSVSNALREGVTSGLLVVDGDACRFRHALVREALYDDLLPGERARLHVAAANALEQADRIAPHTRWAMLAHHWDAARDVPRAFGASVRAATEAERVHAFADAAEQYERALGLRDQVADADERAGTGVVELLLRATDAVQASGRGPRGLVLAEAALRELGPDTPPERRAVVFERIGRINWTLHRGPAAVAAYEQGAALVDAQPPSREQAFVLSALGQSLMLRQLYHAAITVLRRAIDVASTVGADDVQGHALCSLGPCLVGLGQVDEGISTARRAIELSRAAGIADDVGRAYTNLIHNFLMAGRYGDAGAEVGEAIEYVVRMGYARHYGEAITGNAIAALYCAGRWAEAEALHADPRIPNGDAYQELRWLPVLFATGRFDEARAAVRDATASTADADDVQFRASALLRSAQLLVVDGRWDDAPRPIAEAEALAARTDDQYYRAAGFGLGLHVSAGRTAQARDRRDEVTLSAALAGADELLAAARAFALEHAERGVVLLPEPNGWLVTAEAEHARAHGTDDGDTWAKVASTWDEIGQPYPAAVARYRQADALLRAGSDREQAAAIARAALEVADRLGALPLSEELRQLARRGRLDLSARAVVAAPELGLHVTPRELDVLRLLAEGRTNRQIGHELFISEKTASVHVTNLLRKLGVANRVEAAAVAHRAGINSH